MGDNSLHEQLHKYLTDCHSIEIQALAQLKRAPKIAGGDELAAMYEQHERETEDQKRLVEERLEAHDVAPNKLKDMIMSLGGKGFLLFARAQPDTPGKLLAHALSYEGLEMAAYELLARTADRAGDANVSGIAREIGGQERAMMHRLEGCYDGVVETSLRAVDRPSRGGSGIA